MGFEKFVLEEIVLSRLKAGGAGTTTKEKVTLQREGFKRPASQHSGWSQLCRRRTFKRLLKVESDLATVIALNTTT